MIHLINFPSLHIKILILNISNNVIHLIKCVISNLQNSVRINIFVVFGLDLDLNSMEHGHNTKTPIVSLLISRS